jgi:small ligand-binding sensory domain FIST
LAFIRANWWISFPVAGPSQLWDTTLPSDLPTGAQTVGLLQMQSVFGSSQFLGGLFDESALRGFAQSVRQALAGPDVSLGLVFLTPGLMADAPQVLEILRVHAQIPLLLGCSSPGLIAGDHE